MPDDTYDYIIIGAGTAGCVLAARLSVEPQVKVALLEFGGQDTNPAIYQTGLNPMFSLWNPQGAENWGYRTVPQAGLNGRSIDIARGKVLGGCSAVNAMIYIRGNRRDFDQWSHSGAKGWSYGEVLPYFKKSETYHGPISQYHGDNGPMPVIDYLRPSEVGLMFMDAAAALGARQKQNDFNGATQEAGAGFYQSTRTPEGVRASAASAFLRPNFGRPGLKVFTLTRARRLIITARRVVGVECEGPDGLKTLRAEREVLVCCGAFESPKLLMNSGLGPAAHLAEHGVPLVQDLPGVGANLQDHLLLGVGFESRIPLEPPEMLAEAGLFTWTDKADKQESPNLQYFFGPVQFLDPAFRTDNPGFTFAPILAQPLSRGTVRLASSDPKALAQVDPQYLSREEDVAVLEYGIRYARELASTSAFDRARGKELGPGASAASSREIREYIRKVAGTVWHPVGTCRMGSGPDAVVDNALRVYGVKALRVVDASIMPTIPNGNPNAAITMIAEKAADLIRGGAQVQLNSPIAL